MLSGTLLQVMPCGDAVCWFDGPVKPQYLAAGDFVFVVSSENFGHHEKTVRVLTKFGLARIRGIILQAFCE